MLTFHAKTIWKCFYHSGIFQLEKCNLVLTALLAKNMETNEPQVEEVSLNIYKGDSLKTNRKDRKITGSHLN